MVDIATVVNLIAATTTETGLRVECVHDTRIYEKGAKVTDIEIAGINIKPADFHPEWNYTICPKVITPQRP